MGMRQLLAFALGGLWRQKVRTTLTLVGVMVGTCALAFSLALGLGLREFIETEFKGREDFWRITVHVEEPPPDPSTVPEKEIAVRGNMSDERKARIREALLERYQATRAPRLPAPLTPEKLRAIAALPDVAEVRTYRSGQAYVWIDSSNLPARGLATSGKLDDLKPRLIAGRLPEHSADEIVLSELALYQLGIQDEADLNHVDADLERALGRTVKLDVGGVENAQSLALARALIGRRPPEKLTRKQLEVLDKLTEALPKKLDAFDLTEAEKNELRKLFETPAEPTRERPHESSKVVSGHYRIVGVVRILTREDRKKRDPLARWELTNSDAFLPPATGERLFGRLPWAEENGFYSAEVRVKPGGDLPGTAEAIDAMGYRTFSLSKWFAAAKREVTLIAAGLNLFAMIALFVAGIGITNTLVTSVVERTKEIGILRAVGATRGQIMGLFLLEGAIVGLLGAALGLALARGFIAWADRWVRGLIEKQMDGEKMLSTTIFAFPWWLWVGAVVFAVGVTTLAALYPARRAAKIHPIEALRYG